MTIHILRNVSKPAPAPAKPASPLEAEIRKQQTKKKVRG